MTRILIYIFLGWTAVMGALDSHEHECGKGRDAPIGVIVGVWVAWPAVVPWAATKGSDPLWDCER